MGTFTAGQVVIVHFPFSDLTASKLRPAVVLAEAGRGDWILCPAAGLVRGGSRSLGHFRGPIPGMPLNLRSMKALS